MSQIYLLGREDADGLARLNRRPLLTFDDEVGGWDTLCSNDETYCRDYPHSAARLPDRKPDPLLHVFDSRMTVAEPSKDDSLPEDQQPWPTITYQTRFGEDQ